MQIVTCGGRLSKKVAPDTRKARLPTVEILNSGTASWLVVVDRNISHTYHLSDS